MNAERYTPNSITLRLFVQLNSSGNEADREEYPFFLEISAFCS